MSHWAYQRLKGQWFGDEHFRHMQLQAPNFGFTQASGWKRREVLLMLMSMLMSLIWDLITWYSTPGALICLNMFVLFSVCSLKLFHRLLLIEFGHFYSSSNVKQLEIDNFYILQKIFSYYLVFTDSFSEMLNIYWKIYTISLFNPYHAPPTLFLSPFGHSGDRTWLSTSCLSHQFWQKLHIYKSILATPGVLRVYCVMTSSCYTTHMHRCDFQCCKFCDWTVICAELIISRQVLISAINFPDTRRASTVPKNKQTGDPLTNSSNRSSSWQLQLNLQQQQLNTNSDDHDPDDREVNQLLDSLSEESKTLVKIITLVITKKMKLETELLKKELIKKDSQITKLSEVIVGLEEKVRGL